MDDQNGPRPDGLLQFLFEDSGDFRVLRYRNAIAVRPEGVRNWCGLFDGCRALPSARKVSVGNDGTSRGGPHDGKSVAEQTEQAGPDRSLTVVDIDPHDSKNRIARRLNVFLQHLLGTASGDEHVGADHLGGVVRSDPYQFRRSDVQPDGTGQDYQDQQ